MIHQANRWTRARKRWIFIQNPETGAWEIAGSIENPDFIALMETATGIRWAESTLLRMVRRYRRMNEPAGALWFGTLGDGVAVL